MKEILFRGKTESGRWVYGSLILAGAYCCILEKEEDVHPMDYPYLDSYIGTIDGKATPVIPETVGRLLSYPYYDNYTDQVFYEGDILEVYDRHCIVPESEPKYIAIAVAEDCIWEGCLGRRFTQDTVQTKIIGNVHDNPELIGEHYANLYKQCYCLEVNPDENHI